MKGRSLYFLGTKEVEVREEEIGEPGEGEVLVESKLSSISAGTEMHFYRGELSRGITVDDRIGSLKQELEYPLKYGYSNVGKVVSIGEGVPDYWLDQIVFTFNPHESHHIHDVEDLLMKPKGMGAEKFSFLPFVETAVNFLMDGRPVMGERVVVFGQGVIGVLTTALLDKFPIDKLVSVENLGFRRNWSEKMGADISVSGELDEGRILEKSGVEDFDLAFEVSGNIHALEKAVKVTGFGGRIIVGSWYSGKGSIELGTDFHRKRLELKSSQVSTISGSYSDRWDTHRRLKTSIEMLDEIGPERLISHRIPFEDAGEAYEMIDGDEETMQVLLEY